MQNLHPHDSIKQIGSSHDILPLHKGKKGVELGRIDKNGCRIIEQ
jgi:hypothetical protein